MKRREVLKNGVLGLAGLSLVTTRTEAKNVFVIKKDYPWISVKDELPDKLKNVFLLFISKNKDGKIRCRVNFYVSEVFDGRVWYGFQNITTIFVNGEKLRSGFSTFGEYRQLMKNGGYVDIMWKYTDKNVQLPDVGELPCKNKKMLEK